MPRSGFGRARYRAWQLLRGLRSHLSLEEIREVRTLLSVRELDLFLRMEGPDQRHSVDLLHELRRDATASGTEAPHSHLVAALVHDVGKGPLRMWHRVAFVMLDAAPGNLGPWCEAEHGAPWRQALWRLRRHARLGAALLVEAGSDPRVIAVVAAHTSVPPAGDEDLTRFVRADDRV